MSRSMDAPQPLPDAGRLRGRRDRFKGEQGPLRGDIQVAHTYPLADPDVVGAMSGTVPIIRKPSSIETWTMAYGASAW